MQIKIECDEWYPIYYLIDKNSYHGFLVDIPEEDLQDIWRVFKEFHETQLKLERYLAQ